MTMSTEELTQERIRRSYRRARTYPKTIRKLANLDLPYPVTIPQLAVWLLVFVGLWYARPLWTPIAGSLQILILVGVPTCAAVVLRHLRLEGRSPVAMAAGLWALWWAPRTGTIHATAVRIPRPSKYGGLLIIQAVPLPPQDETAVRLTKAADQDEGIAR